MLIFTVEIKVDFDAETKLKSDLERERENLAKKTKEKVIFYTREIGLQ